MFIKRRKAVKSVLVALIVAVVTLKTKIPAIQNK